ncbi:hypothetical protein ACLB2K_056308 [Fragaria x ananassa]
MATSATLSPLRLLNLSNNVFNRTFPPELSNLTNLRVLDLYNNNLTCVLPVSVAHMTNLRHLHLGSTVLIRVEHFPIGARPQQRSRETQGWASLGGTGRTKDGLGCRIGWCGSGLVKVWPDRGWAVEARRFGVDRSGCTCLTRAGTGQTLARLAVPRSGASRSSKARGLSRLCSHGFG